MKLVLRSAILWLLMAALPLQALAAASMLHCAGLHQGSGQASQSAAHAPCHEVSTPFEAHEAAADLAVEQAVQTSSHTQAQGPAIDQAQDPAAAGGKLPGASTCSACALCCSLMVLPASPSVLGEPALSRERYLPLPVASVVFLTGGPERPPRSNCA